LLAVQPTDLQPQDEDTVRELTTKLNSYSLDTSGSAVISSRATVRDILRLLVTPQKNSKQQAHESFNRVRFTPMICLVLSLCAASRRREVWNLGGTR